MKLQASTCTAFVRERLADLLYRWFRIGPPAWQRDPLVDQIDLGLPLIAEVRVTRNCSGGESFFVGLIDRESGATIALLLCCHLEDTRALLEEAEAGMWKYKRSVPYDEYCED